MPSQRKIEFERNVNGCMICVSHKTRMNGYVMIKPKGSMPKLLHRIIWEAENGAIPENMRIDHKCQNKECCELSHLRLSTASQNNQYVGLPKNNSSGYKGVTFCKRAKKYMAQIAANCKHMNLGYFVTASDAAHAYDNAATIHHGAFAITNKSLGLI